MLEMDGIWCYEVIIFANFIALWTTINLSSFAARVFPFSFLFFSFSSFSLSCSNHFHKWVLYFYTKFNNSVTPNQIPRFCNFPPSVQNNAGPSLFRISIHKYIIRAHECPINNTFALHPPIPIACLYRTPSIISINTFITIISQAAQEISFCEIWRLCAGYTRVNLYKPRGRGVLQYTPLQAGLTSPRNILRNQPFLTNDVIVNVLHYHTLHEFHKPITCLFSLEKKNYSCAFENLHC